jgi:hypothetical protein
MDNLIMEITFTKTPKKLNSMYNKIHKDGMEMDDIYIHVGECMEDGDRLFTPSQLSSAMDDVYNEALKALQKFPDAQIALKKHFGDKN